MFVDLHGDGLFSTSGSSIDVWQRRCRTKLAFKPARSMFLRKKCLENEKNLFTGNEIECIERLWTEL